MGCSRGWMDLAAAVVHPYPRGGAHAGAGHRGGASRLSSLSCRSMHGQREAASESEEKAEEVVVEQMATVMVPKHINKHSLKNKALSVSLDKKALRFSEFGADGGPAAKALKPKYNLFVKQVSNSLGMAMPHIDIKTVIAATMFLKAFGGLLFIISSSFGAFLLLLYLAFITPIVYDFYNYEMETPQFVQLFVKFSQNLALFGALLFFLGMKNSFPRRHFKRTTRTKTN